MNEKFHQSSAVSRDKMKSLMLKKNSPALPLFAVMYGLFLVSSVLLVWSYSQPWWVIFISLIFFGIMGCSLFASEHETVHNTAFRSSRLNYFASLLCGIGHLYPPTIFRDLHFTHHRYTHVPGKDPEISFGHKPITSVVEVLPFYLVWLSGIPLLFFKLLMVLFGALGMPEPIRKLMFPFVRKESRLTIALESQFILFVYTGLIIIANFYNSGYWLLFIGQVVAHCLLSTYLVMEHNGLPHEGNILEKTRSIRTNKFVKLLMWNMPYHAEHHAYPAVPFYQLPELHKELSDELIHKDLGHPEFHIQVLKGKFLP